MRTSLYAWLIEIAHAGLAGQRSDGSMAPGHNGPHGDPEQPSRNTGHWLMLWAFAYRHSGEQRYYQAAMRAADYLVQPERRPGGFTVHHRDKVGKDRCNGLMGPAFTLEALCAGGVTLEREDMLSLATQIYRMHPYVPELGLWRVRDIDGTLHGVDHTLNHQIWFAATAAEVLSASGAEGLSQVRHFVGMLRRTMGLRANGRIKHLAIDPGLKAQLKRSAKRLLGRVEGDPSPTDTRREIAYHVFNIYPLTFLSRNCPQSPFWTSKTFRVALAYPEADEYVDAANDPSFIVPYIPAGFPLSFAERALADQVFGPNDRVRQAALIVRQRAMTYDTDARALTRNSIDPITQAARSYEMTRLADVPFELQEPLQVGAST